MSAVIWTLSLVAFAGLFGWQIYRRLRVLPRVRALEIVKETRTWERPSDHVPVVIDLA